MAVNAGFSYADATRRWKGDDQTCKLVRYDLKVWLVRLVIVAIVGTVDGELAGFLALGSLPVRYRPTDQGADLEGVVTLTASAKATERVGQMFLERTR